MPQIEVRFGHLKIEAKSSCWKQCFAFLFELMYWYTGGSLDSHVSSFKAQSYNYKSMIRIPGGYDPCYTPHVQKYFNRTDVKKAFHANTGIDYKVCSDHVLNSYNYTISSVLPIYTKLDKSGLKIWIYRHAPL